MQMNLKLFSQDTVKNIVFVIRDWDEEANLEDAIEKVNKYLLDIWNDIPKPENFLNMPFSNLFTVQVFTLCYYKMKEFNIQCGDLRKKLVDQSHEEFLFKNFDYDRNLPLDGMPFYLANIWTTIANNKDLNLPNEKVLVSNLRCSQIKGDCIEAIREQIQKIEEAVQKDELETLGQEAVQLIHIAQQKYRAEAKDYAKEVFQEKEVELEAEIMNKFYVIFQKQVEQIKKKILHEFNQLIDQFKQIENVNDLIVPINEIRETIPLRFKEKLMHSVIQPDLWKENEYIDSFRSQIEQQINNYIENQMTIYLQRLDKIIKIKCESIVGTQISSISMDFWLNIEQEFTAEFVSRQEKSESIIEQLKIADSLESKFLNQFQRDSYENLYTVIKSQSSRFKEALVSKQQVKLILRFKQMFVRNEQGQPRDWKKQTEEEILHLFNGCKEQVFDLYNMIKHIKITEVNMAKMKASKKVQSVLLKKPIEQRKQSIAGFETVMPEVQYLELKNTLLEEFDIQYADALQKHKQDFLQNIPKAFWFLLLFFMYDDILRWLGNPLLLYPILIILCFIGFCIAIGYHNLPKVLAQQMIRQVNVSLMPLIFGGISKLKSS